MNARPLLGAAAGPALGAGAWGLMVDALPWSGFMAAILGCLAGGGSRLAGGRGTRAAFLAAIVAAAGIAAGLGFAFRKPLEGYTRVRAEAVGRPDYEQFGKAAADWNPRLRGNDAGKFAQAWDLLPGSALDRPGPRIDEFLRTTAPLLDAWKRRPPEFEEWRAERRAAILREADSPWASYLRSPLRFFTAFDLLFVAMGIAFAGKAAYVPAPAEIVRRRAGA